MMRALKVNFGGDSLVTVDWNGEVSGIAGLAQRAGVSVMTQAGSDKFIPARGTEVTRTLLSYGAFDYLGIQHLLNFGALKAGDDMREYEAPDRPDEDRLQSLRMLLLGVSNNSAQVAVDVTSRSGESTREITSIS